MTVIVTVKVYTTCHGHGHGVSHFLNNLTKISSCVPLACIVYFLYICFIFFAHKHAYCDIHTLYRLCDCVYDFHGLHTASVLQALKFHDE